MKVRILTPIAGVLFIYRTGEIVDLPPKEVERWLSIGAAEIVKERIETTMLEPPERAVAPAQRKKARKAL